MNLLDKMKTGYDKAKEGVSDFAETAKIKHQISQLNGRKTELLNQVGQKVFALVAAGHAVSEVETECQTISSLEKEIEQKGEEIARINVEHA